MGLQNAYPDDSGVSDNDKLLGVNESGATRNFPLSAVKEYMGFTTDPAGGWETLADQPDTITYNGNRSYDLVFNGQDHTDIFSEGMRIRTTRTVTPPTQMTSLNGTSQYWSKTSPNKLTFTDDLVCYIKVKLNSYPSTDSAFISRYDGSSGFWFGVNSSGQITLSGHNAGAANWSRVVSYQSIPLNKEITIAAQLDMSAFTATTTTSYIMIDGVDVPAQVLRNGTNPTALVQAGTLQIGALNGANFAPSGKYAQAAIFNAKVTQATLRGYMSQGLSGSETSTASSYSFNGVATDLNTSTPNDLTANGSAGYVTDSPFSGGGTLTASKLDYGIVTKTAFSTNTTLTVQVPEGYSIPTSGGVSAVSYSSQKVPYLFPADRARWIVALYQIYNSGGITFSSTNVWHTSSRSLTVPPGIWKIGYKGTLALSSTVGAVRSGFYTLSSSAPTNAVYNQDLTSRLYAEAHGNILTFLNTWADHTLSSQTTYTLYAAIDASSGSETFLIRGDQGRVVIYAELDYV